MLRLATSVFALLGLISGPFAAEQSQDALSVSVLPMFAQTKPAVDGVNGKLQVYGGAGQGNSVTISAIPGLSAVQPSTVWKGISGAMGTVTVPIGHAFGAQIDMGSGTFGNRPLGDAAGHLFWRDPDKGLVGAYGSGILLGDHVGRGVWTAAGEFEAYFGKFTGRALIGLEGASAYTASLTSLELQSYGGNSSFDKKNYFHDIVEATFYPIDDLALSVGHIYSFGRNAITGEVEYLLPQFRGGNIAPSTFVQASYGWNSSSNIMAGVRIYFGNHDKTLIRRQREDDPMARPAPDTFPPPHVVRHFFGCLLTPGACSAPPS